MIEYHSGARGADRFFITGCQRSGTTVLAMALEAHPMVKMIEENNTRFHVQGALTRELDLRAASRQEIAEGGRMVGYKAPRDSHRIDEIVDIFPMARIVWVERIVFQTVASMLALPDSGTSWAVVRAPREIEKYISKTGDEKARRMFEAAVKIEDQTAKAVAFATLCWLVKREQRKLASRRLGTRLLFVDYDELTVRPKMVLAGVVEFLELSWSPLVLNHPSSIANTTHPGQSVSGRPIDVLSRHKWKGEISHADIEIITNIKRSFEGDSTLDLSGQSER